MKVESEAHVERLARLELTDPPVHKVVPANVANQEQLASVVLLDHVVKPDVPVKMAHKENVVPQDRQEPEDLPDLLDYKVCTSIADTLFHRNLNSF